MERYRLAELADITGVTQRTIRFYIAEGLLPAPEGAGPAAVYTAAHRDRLLLINGLKDRYLPLRAIRKQLATLTEADIRAELQQLAATPPLDPMTVPSMAGNAVDYLDDILGRGQVSPAPTALPPPNPPPAVPPLKSVASISAREHWERIMLADGVELHVRADRLREAIPLDALVRQARKLLGEG